MAHNCSKVHPRANTSGEAAKSASEANIPVPRFLCCVASGSNDCLWLLLDRCLENACCTAEERPRLMFKKLLTLLCDFLIGSGALRMDVVVVDVGGAMMMLSSLLHSFTVGCFVASLPFKIPVA